MLITDVTKKQIESYWSAGEMPTSITGSILELREQLMSQAQYVEEIKALTCVQELPEMTHQRSKYLFIYVVQLILTESSQLLNEIIDTAMTKVEQLFIDHKVMLELEEGFVEVDENGVRIIKVRTGTKKEQAIQMRREFWNDDDPAASRKTLKQMFIDELDMSIAGATTYLSITRKALEG